LNYGAVNKNIVNNKIMVYEQTAVTAGTENAGKKPLPQVLNKTKL
jgi:hypothetical protein